MRIHRIEHSNFDRRVGRRNVLDSLPVRELDDNTIAVAVVSLRMPDGKFLSCLEMKTEEVLYLFRMDSEIHSFI